jgi:hypothetical protein
MRTLRDHRCLLRSSHENPALPRPTAVPACRTPAATRTKALLAVLGLGLALGQSACGGAVTSARPDMRTLEEGRAVLVIQQAMNANGTTPDPGRDVPLPNGNTLHVDVIVGGTGYGVAFLTPQAVQKIGSALPPRRNADEMRITRLGDVSVLLLYDDAYQYDAGETHTATAVAAERKLTKDVGDFITRVVKAQEVR